MDENLFNPEFDKSFSGYKTSEVDAYITKLLAMVTSLKEENETLEEKIEVLAEHIQAYREDEDSLREALVGAQKMSDSIIKNANSKAEITMREASVKAAHIVQDAHQKMENEKNELIRVRQEVSSFKSSLISLYKKHIEMIMKFPGSNVVIETEDPVKMPAPVRDRAEEASDGREERKEEAPAPDGGPDAAEKDEAWDSAFRTVSGGDAPEGGTPEDEAPAETAPEEETEQETRDGREPEEAPETGETRLTEDRPDETAPGRGDAEPGGEKTETPEDGNAGSGSGEASDSPVPPAGADIFEEFERRTQDILNFSIDDEEDDGRRSRFADLKFGDNFSLLDDD